MNENVEEQAGLRDYLLGILSDQTKMRQIEEKLLLEDKFADTLSVAEEKLIEDYLEGSLSKEHRERFAQFFLSTPERKQQLRLTQNVRRYSSRAGRDAASTDLWPRFVKMFSIPVPAMAALAAVVLVMGWIVFFHRSETQMITQLLDRAYQAERPFESRVSGLGYAPYNITRGGKTAPANQRELDAADRISADSALKGETAVSLQNAGRIYLVKGEIDQAILQFEKARELTPDNAEIFNDLGTAYLEKSKTATENAEKDASGLNLELKAKALEKFNKAIEIDPALLAAYFNKALVLQQMNLPGEARAAWQEYLKLDSTSDWANEARRNLEALPVTQLQKPAGEILRDFMSAYERQDDDGAYRVASRNREMISGKLIPQQLAFLFLVGPKEAPKENPKEVNDKYLSALSYLGRIESERSGDPYLSEIARYYFASTPAQRAASLKGYESLHKGYALCLENDCHGAAEVFKDSQQSFDLAGNIWEAKLCDYWIGYVLFREGKVAESSMVLGELADFGRSKGYKWLTAQALSWLAINMYASRDLSRSLDYNRKALAISRELSDLYLIEKISAQMADTYFRFGDYSQAVAHIHKALEVSLQPDASLRQRWRDFEVAANIFFGMKNYEAALAYKRESVELAAVTKEDTFFTASYTGMGIIYGTQKKYKEALESLDKSSKITLGFQDEALKNRTYAYSLVQMGHIERLAGNCARALAKYDEALSFLDRSQFPAYAYDGYKGRLQCHYENKDDASFQAELPVILNLFKEYRSRITEEQNRNVFFNNEQNVYDIAIDQEFNNTNYELAFAYSEQSRARTLLDLQNAPVKISNQGPVPEIKLPADTVEPLGLKAIQARMPANVQLVQYSVLADKIVAWVITKDSFTATKTEVPAEILSARTTAYVQLAAKSDSSADGRRELLAKELYRTLISPVAEKLDAKKHICIIPDKILFRLPFSTLVSPESGKYFIAEYSFFISPSANIFLLCSEKALQLGQSPDELLLSIGNPDFDKKEFAGLSDLARAETESRDISGFYPRNILLTGKDATKRAVENDLRKANVIHFAGHYLVNGRQPLLSGLVLAAPVPASDAGEFGDELLANHEIIRGKLVSAKLIVLSACQTGVERFYDGEGMIGSARAFLATGVPLVIASQWKVDSDATAELMVHFHRYRKQEGLSTVEALRRAQLDMLEGDDKQRRDPYYWAAFQAIGGYAEF